MAIRHTDNRFVTMSLRDVPAGMEQVKALGENIVVNEASVDRESPHEQDDVPAAMATLAPLAWDMPGSTHKKNMPKIWDTGISAGREGDVTVNTYLAQVGLAQLSLKQDHEGGRDERDEAVTNVAEHDGKQEGESNDSEETRIDLLIASDTIAVHNGLESFGELVGAHESWGFLVRPELVQNWRYVGAGFLLPFQR